MYCVNIYLLYKQYYGIKVRECLNIVFIFALKKKTFMSSKIYGLGETLVDIIFKDDIPQGAKPGGSAFNSMVSLARCGEKIEFISEIGQCDLGSLVYRFMQKNGMSTKYMNRYRDGKTALSLAFLDEQNDAKYSFYKNYPEERLDVDMPVFNGNDYFLFGSYYAINRVTRSKVVTILDLAKKNGTIVLYDPNFRSGHLHEKEELMSTIEENFCYADIVRASDEDFTNIYGTTDAKSTYAKLKNRCKVLIYTANKNGVTVCTESEFLTFNVPQIEPVSTIGAGDNFNAGVLYTLKKLGIHNIASINKEQWKVIINTAIEFSTDTCLTYDNYVSEKFGLTKQENL